jgi:hypothetical protein
MEIKKVKIKKGELEMKLPIVDRLMELRDLSWEQKIILISNKRELEAAWRNFMQEIEPKPEGEWAELEADMRKRGDVFYQKHKTDINNHNRGYTGGEQRIPPQLMDEWNKVIKLAEDKFPEGVKMKAEHISKITTISQEETEVGIVMMKDTGGITAKEMETLLFMFEC